ncbi:MAG: SPFH domain-containing protein [Phycisphaerae bacterium]
MTSKLEQLNEFLEREQSLAAMVPAETLFGMLTRSYDAPANWCALARKNDGKFDVTPPGDIIRADGIEDVLFVRSSPFEVQIDADEIPSRDAFLFECSARVLMTIPAERTDLASFRERVLGSYTLATTDNVRRYVETEVTNAFQRACAEADAAQLLDGDARERVAHLVTEALQGPCFAAGLELADNVKVTLSCDSYDTVRKAGERAAQKQRAHEAEQQLRDALRDAQSRHLDHLSSLIDRAKQLASQSPEMGVQDVIKSFPTQDRGQLYKALLSTPSRQSKPTTVVVATSRELLFYDTSQPNTETHRMPLDGPPGPIRSIQLCGSMCGPGDAFLVGASRGVYVVNANGTNVDRLYMVNDAPNVRGGFNAVARGEHSIIATHSELGIVRWNIDQPQQAQRLFPDLTRNADAVRGALIRNGKGYASVGNTIVSWNEDKNYPTPPAEPTETWQLQQATSPFAMTAFAPTDAGMFAGTSNGFVYHWSHDNAEAPTLIHQGFDRAVETVQWIDADGVSNLMIADLTSRLSTRVLDDSFVMHYEAGGQTLRRAEANRNVVVAMNDLRDRLICWTPGEGDRATHVIPVAAAHQAHIQDFCLT